MTHPRYEFIGKYISYRQLPRRGWFGKQRVSLSTPFKFHTSNQETILVPATVDDDDMSDTFDGFSVPLALQIASLNQLHPWMAGVEASMVHDVLCMTKAGTRKWRRKVFIEAYDVAMQNAGSQEKWSSTIKRGVAFGSKYVGFC